MEPIRAGKTQRHFFEVAKEIADGKSVMLACGSERSAHGMAQRLAAFMGCAVTFPTPSTALVAGHTVLLSWPAQPHTGK